MAWTVQQPSSSVGFCGSLSIPSRARCCCRPVHPPVRLTLFFTSWTCSSEWEKERTRSWGPRRRKHRMPGCLVVGGAHKTVEETRKKGTNRPYMDRYLPLVPGREDVEGRSLPAFSAPDARHAKGCPRRAACSRCSARCSAGWHLIKLGRRRSKLTLQAAACWAAGQLGLVMGREDLWVEWNSYCDMCTVLADRS